MNSPLRLFRDLLSRKQLPGAGPEASPSRAGEQVERAPLETIAHLSTAVLPRVANQPDPQLRFAMLEDARCQAESALPPLEDQIAGAVLPLPKAATAAAIQVDNFLKGMVLSYADLARDIVSRPDHAGLSKLYHQAVQRALALLARRQLLAYRAYAAPSEASWQQLHDFYHMACNPRAKPLNGETAPIEHEYLGALLFAYFEPARLPRGELDAIGRCTRQLAAYAVVTDQVPEATANRTLAACFLVRPGERGPGLPLTRLPAGVSPEGGLIVECTQVVAAIDRNLARLPGKTAQPQLDLSTASLQSLRLAIGGRSVRRFHRNRFKPRTELVGGLDQVIRFLDGKRLSRRALDRDDEREAIVPSEWALIDQSPDGFRLHFINGEKSSLGAGDIVAIQPRESSHTHVCLVRRVSTAASRLELGLQLLSPQVSVVHVDGGDAAPLAAIFLHSLPAHGPGAGLIAAPGRFTGGQRIRFGSQGRQLERSIGQCLVANDGLEFFALDPLPD